MATDASGPPCCHSRRFLPARAGRVERTRPRAHPRPHPAPARIASVLWSRRRRTKALAGERWLCCQGGNRGRVRPASGTKGGMHRVRGASGDLLARGPGFPPDLSPRALPSPPVSTLPKHSAAELLVLWPAPTLRASAAHGRRDAARRASARPPDDLKTAEAARSSPPGPPERCPHPGLVWHG